MSIWDEEEEEEVTYTCPKCGKSGLKNLNRHRCPADKPAPVAPVASMAPAAPVMDLKAVLRRAWGASTWYIPRCPVCNNKKGNTPSKSKVKCPCGHEWAWDPPPLWISLFRVRDYIDTLG